MPRTVKKKPPAAAPPALPPRAYTLWVTRDSDPETGRLSNHVEAWFVRPARLRSGARGALWFSRGGMADRAARWSLADCRLYARTVPDDDRMCLRIEGDVVRGAAEAGS